MNAPKTTLVLRRGRRCVSAVYRLLDKQWPHHLVEVDEDSARRVCKRYRVQVWIRVVDGNRDAWRLHATGFGITPSAAVANTITLETRQRRRIA